MSNVLVTIAPAAGVTVPTDPAPPLTTPVDLAFDRDSGKDESGQPLPSVRDVVRGALDASLAGSVTLPDPVLGSKAELRFLSGTGAVRAVASVDLPAAPVDSIEFELTPAHVAEIAKPDPQPVANPVFVRRDARLAPIEGETVEFSALSIAVTRVPGGSGAWAQFGLATMFGADEAITTSVPFSDPLPTALAGLDWTPTHLAVDGQFTAYFPKSSDNLWLWWLSGPVGAIGAVEDDLDKEGGGLVQLPLPPLGQPAPVSPGMGGHVAAPVAGSEREVVDNPGVYSEDPGAFCKPFSNPERVLGERSFSVIYRAEQPIVSPEASIRTVTGPLLDFELPDGVRDAILTADEERRPSILRRATEVFRGGAAPERNVATALRAPLLDVFVTRDVLPGGVFDDLVRTDRDRRVVDAQHPVQWDSDASRYQAVTVSRGHILEYRMRWRSNGYSLGTVAKTLTLAARQVKRIQKIEWRRLERTRREERTQLLDRVSDAVVRERQYDDSVEASLSEWSRGESESSTASGAGGFGFATAGFVIGGGGGGSNASSSASASGGRRTTAAEEQRLRDSIRRYGESLRRLESIVVNEVTQEEEVTGTSEVVRNPNYGHALTVIYYQILRHLKVETAFAGVRECLFVPFAIKPFTVARAFRWRDLLRRGLLDQRFDQAMRYLKDVLTGFVGSPIPPGRRSDQPIRHVSGSLYIQIAVARPRDLGDGTFDAAAWGVLNPFLGLPAAGIFSQLRDLAESRRDRQFQEEHAPGVAARWVNTLQIEAGGATLDADLTLASRYQFNGTVRVDFSAPARTFLSREMLASLRIFATHNLPPNSVANLTRVSITYQTDQFQRTFSGSSGQGDLVSPQTGVRDQGATVFSLPDVWERQDVRAEMVRAVNDLIGHLNEHAEHYHKAIWWNMDRDRIFMLVDGFEVPGYTGTSIGSVIERDPIAIVGNSLVFRVSPGSFLGLGKITEPKQLYEYYATHQPISDPMLISLPTDGLYAQAIMDECEALEEHYGSTDWVLSDKEPEVGELDPSLLMTRRAEPVAATPSAFPQTLINLQNAPDAPAPAGFADVLNAVTNANAFRDMAGLAGTQANAAAALQQAAGLATSFGQQAAALKLAQMAKDAQKTQTADQRLATIKRAEDKGLATPAQAQQHATKVLEELHAPTTTPPHENHDFSEAIDKAAGMPGSTVEATTPDGQVRVSIAGDAEPPSQRDAFVDLDGRVRTESEVRAAVVSKAIDEQRRWITPAGTLLGVGADSQFAHLVRYWLYTNASLRFTQLDPISDVLLDTTVTPANRFLRLLKPASESAAHITADVATVGEALLINVPDGDYNMVEAAVQRALVQARNSRLGNNQNPWAHWDGAFLNACVRAAERSLELEGPSGSRQALLALSRDGEDFEIVRAAHVRRFGCVRADGTFDPACRQAGTYHAFEPDERPIRVGDIIVADNRPGRTDNPSNLWRFEDSQTNLGHMRGDIVVEVNNAVSPPYAETIGGAEVEGCRRQRFPLRSDGKLFVDRAQNTATQQDDATFPALPVAGSAAGDLEAASTARIFAVLSPVG